MNLQLFAEKIKSSFDLTELESLCFDLGISYENLSGDTLNKKVEQLVKYCQRRSCLPNLLNRCKKLRPNQSWAGVAELFDQLPPQIGVDKLRLLCWVYVKTEGSIFQQVIPQDLAHELKLEQMPFIQMADFLHRYNLIKFRTWFMGICIKHEGIVKVEHDMLQTGFVLDDFPEDIIEKIKKLQQMRLSYLRCLYEKSQSTSFQKGVSGTEIAEEIGEKDYQIIHLGVPHYLKRMGWLHIRGVPNVQITMEGIDKIESEQG